MEQTGRKKQQNKLLMTLMFTLIISMTSGIMFNIVLPQITADFNITTAQVSWITTIYILVLSIATVMYGKLSDRYSLKNIITFGFTLCAVGSLIGVFAQSYEWILVGRFIQALGAAVSLATTMIIPVRYFSQEERGRALGMASTGIAIGNALGPVISALIVSILDWRWLFCLPIFFVLTIPFYRKYLVDHERVSTKFDWIGGLFLGTSVALLMLSVTEGIFLYALGGLFVLCLFVLRIHKTDTPFIRPNLFKNKQYTLGLLIAFLLNATGYSFYFLSPLLFANVNELSPSLVGFSMVPGAVTAAYFGLKGGKLADTRGNSYLFYLASVLLLTCYFLLSTFVGVTAYVIAIFLIVGNVGQTFITIAMSNAVSRTLPQEDAGVGMGLLATLNFISGGMAVAVYSKMVDLGSLALWNPLHFSEAGSVYSNIYLVLFGIQVYMLVFYYYQFGRKERVIQINKPERSQA